tara:strand:- start:5458 stop:5709 length:252 start_codon:yes stop_codon:yes gene_type:complete
MPRYTYVCKKCEKTFETTHSMHERLENCNFLDCDGTLKRIPPIVNKKKVKNDKVGQEVKSFIEKTKNEVKKEKQRLKKQEYKQ